MKIGIPKEIKDSEHRVGMTPSGVQTLVENKHDVFVQSRAGLGSRFSDDDYKVVGAKILKTIEEVYEPYLIKEGYIQRTTRGRIALEKAYQYCNKTKDNSQNQGDIF